MHDNKVWTCSRCGSVDFKVNISCVIFNEEGQVIESSDSANDVECNQCGDWGDGIEDIAEYKTID